MRSSLLLPAVLKNSPSLQTFNAKLNPHLFQFPTKLSDLFVHAYGLLPVSYPLCVVGSGAGAGRGGGGAGWAGGGGGGNCGIIGR